MFATLRYNQNTKAIEQPPLISQRACINCRARKIRCSAADDGCDCCKVRNLKCEYPKLRRRKGPRLSKPIPVSTCVSGSITADTKMVEVALPITTLQPDAQQQDLGTLMTISTENLPEHGDYPLMQSSTTVATVDTNQPDHGSMSLDFLDSFDLTPLDSTDASSLPQATSPWLLSGGLTLSDIDNTFQPMVSSTTPSSSLMPPSHKTSPVDTSHPSTSLDISAFRVNEYCNCQVIALHLLESLCIAESQCSFRNVGRILGTNKNILVQCGSLLRCTICSTVSYFMMLLTTICQRITSCFGKIIAVLTQQYNRLQNQRKWQTHLDLSPDDQDDDSHQMTIRDYDLDLDEEPCLFGALALIQLRRLQVILNHIREVTIAQRWDLHTNIVDQVVADLFAQIGLYDKPKSIDE